MTWFDYGVLLILGFSLLVGLLRGVLRELVMLVGWISAFVLASIFSKEITPLMPESLGPMLAPLLAYVAIFVVVLIAAGFVALLLTLLAKSAGMGTLNRMMGAGFGVMRGLLAVLALVLVALLGQGLPQLVAALALAQYAYFARTAHGAASAEQQGLH